MNTLMKAVHAILVLKHRPGNLESHRLDADSTPTHTDSCATCGSPVRMAERLGEQLLTDVNALLNTKLR